MIISPKPARLLFFLSLCDLLRALLQMRRVAKANGRPNCLAISTLAASITLAVRPLLTQILIMTKTIEKNAMKVEASQDMTDKEKLLERKTLGRVFIPDERDAQQPMKSMSPSLPA